MKREIIIIDDKELILSVCEPKGLNKEFICVDFEITGVDPEDGGGDYEVVLQRLIDGKYFKLCYTHWDAYENFPDDFPDSMQEVFPAFKTITIYE